MTLPLSKKSSEFAGDKIPALAPLAVKECITINNGPESIAIRRMRQEEESDLSDE
jgi:hypothetical protein